MALFVRQCLYIIFLCLCCLFFWLNYFGPYYIQQPDARYADITKHYSYFFVSLLSAPTKWQETRPDD